MNSSGTLFEQFGYSLPLQPTNASVCETNFVCGTDGKWHKEGTYSSDEPSYKCSNTNTLEQMCKTVKQGNTNCIKYENGLTKCFEHMNKIPDMVDSTGIIANTPEPNKGDYICGFNSNEKTHTTILAKSCEECPKDLKAYANQKCPIMSSNNASNDSIDTVEVSANDENTSNEDSISNENSNSNKRNFTCRFPLTKPTSVACKEDNHCRTSENEIVDKWVDSLKADMEKSEFTITDFLGKAVDEHDNMIDVTSDLRTSCLIDSDSAICNTRMFKTVGSLKKFLKSNIHDKTFLNKMQNDRIYGIHRYRELQQGKCVDQQCEGSKNYPIDWVYINPHSDNNVNIHTSSGIPTLVINGNPVQENKNIINCSSNKTCSKYNVDTELDLEVGNVVKPQKGNNVFKIKKGEHVFIVDNEYSVKTEKAKSETECSKLLCTLNQNNCPTNFCKLDENNTCVPGSQAVKATQI